MKLIHREQLENLKQECSAFHEQMSNKLDDLTNSMGLDGNFRAASKLSHVTDRLDLFIKELNEI